MIEKLPKKVIAVGIVSVLGLSACESYKIEDNEFEVVGRVTKVGERSLNVEIGEIQIAEGKAEDAFEVGDNVQIHDNCYDCGEGFFEGRKTTGTLFDYRDNLIELDYIDLGSCVDVQGYMQEYTSDNKSKYRPEFGITKIVDC